MWNRLRIWLWHRWLRPAKAAVDDMRESVFGLACADLPNTNIPFLQLAQVQAKRGKNLAALDTLAAFLNHHPGDLHAAICLARLSDLDEAEARRNQLLVTALEAGAPLEALMPHWLGRFASSGSLAVLRDALDIIASSMGLDRPGKIGEIAHFLATHPIIRQALGVTALYRLAGLAEAAQEADLAYNLFGVIRLEQPTADDPILRQISLLAATGNSARAERQLIDRFSRSPQNPYAATLLARLVSQQPGAPGVVRRAFSERENAFVERCLEDRWGRHSKRAASLGMRLLLERDEIITPRHAPLLASLGCLLADTPERLVPPALRLHPTFAAVKTRNVGVELLSAMAACHAGRYDEALQRLSVVSSKRGEPESALARCLAEAVSLDQETHSQTRLEALVATDSSLGKRMRGKRVLVFSDYGLDKINALTEGWKTAAQLHVVCPYRYQSKPPDNPGRSYDLPDPYLWYLPQGWESYERLRTLTDRVAQEIQADEAFRQVSGFALSLAMLDTFDEIYHAFRVLHRQLCEGGWDIVVGLSPRAQVRSAVTGLVEELFSGVEVLSASEDGFARSDHGTTLIRILYSSKLMIHRTARPLSLRRMVSSLATKVGKVAVLTTNLDDSTQTRSASACLNEMETNRPVLVIARTVYPSQIEAFRAGLPKVKRRRIHIVDENRVVNEAAGVAPFWPRVKQALERASRLLHRHGREGAADAVFTRFLMVAAIEARSNLLRALAGSLAAAELQRQAAYLISIGGRLVFPSAVAEVFGHHNIPTLTCHTAFVNQYAKQLCTPHDLVALVDTAMERLLRAIWKLPDWRMLRVGYVWKPPLTITTTVSAEPAGRLILIVSQPASFDVARRFCAEALEAALGCADAQVVIKPHPNEPAEAVQTYMDICARSPASARVRVADPTEPIAPLLNEAALVIGRWSNVCLEAGLQFKPVIRALYLDEFLHEAWREVGYAVAANSPAELGQRARELLDDPVARANLIESQRNYLRDNPSLVDARGAARIVERMEQSISSARPGGIWSKVRQAWSCWRDDIA